MTSAYGHLVEKELTPSMSEFNSEAIKGISSLIDNEWGKKGNIPIKYLPEDFNTKKIKNKNVIFIMNTVYSHKPWTCCLS